MSEAIKEQDTGTGAPAAESQGKGNGQGAASGSAGAGASEKDAAAKSETVSRAEYNKLQADLDNFKRIEEDRKGKEKKRQEELLKEQGKYKDLYDTEHTAAEAMKVQLEKMNKAVVVMLEEEMKDLPEDFDKTLIPNVDDYDKVVWLRKAKPTFIKKVEPRRGDGTPPAGGEGLTPMRSIYTHPTSPKR